jgi:hypothetical protein
VYIQRLFFALGFFPRLNAADANPVQTGMLLQHPGKLNVEDRVEKYRPEFNGELVVLDLDTSAMGDQSPRRKSLQQAAVAAAP